MPPTEAAATTPLIDAISPFVIARVNANIREGPDQGCLPVTILSRGSQARIIGRDTAATWWFIELNEGSYKGWIGDQTVDVEGDISGVSVISVGSCSPAINSSGENKGERSFEVFDVYHCKYIGNNKFEWYKVEVEYADGLPQAERILEGPFQGFWQPNCPAIPTAIPPEPPTSTPCSEYGCGYMVLPSSRKLLSAFASIGAGIALGLVLVYWHPGKRRE